MSGFYRIFFPRSDRVNRARHSFDHDSIDRMQETGPGFSQFHYESLLSKVYLRDTRDSSSSVHVVTKLFHNLAPLKEKTVLTRMTVDGRSLTLVMFSPDHQKVELKRSVLELEALNKRRDSHIVLQLNGKLIRVFLCEKLRIWASSESFLKLSDFEYSEILTSFLTPF